MQEDQNTEFKVSWRDEYLKEICAFANSKGGVVFVGVDDNGNVVGIENARELLTQIPDKIVATMGIVADVDLKIIDNCEIIKITIDSYSSLISYHGKYYVRSGSTARILEGRELEHRLLKQYGKAWDSITIDTLGVKDVSEEAVSVFKDKALRRGRLEKSDLNVNNTILLDKLKALEGDKLSRAAMLAFYPDPERFVIGAYVKIGFFGDSDCDLRFQDEVHGPLLLQVDKTIDLVYTKYMQAAISYEGIQRVERYFFPKDAFREIILNAIVHKDYSSCNPIQISVYPNKMYIWNDGRFPPQLNTSEKLFAKHSSHPYNPSLANIFFKGGLIEAWGRGFEKIVDACEREKAELPHYDIGESGVMVLCSSLDNILKTILKRSGAKVDDNYIELQKNIILVIRNQPDVTYDKLMSKLKISRWALNQSLNVLKENGVLKRVGSLRAGHWEMMI